MIVTLLKGFGVKSISIKNQLRVTTLIPVLMVALLFAVFYNGQLRYDLKQHTSRLGAAYIHPLLPAAQLALLKNDQRTLQGLIDASTVNPEIQSLAFYNANGQLLAYRGGKPSLKTRFSPPRFTGDFIESQPMDAYTINFIAPITIPKFNLYSSVPAAKTLDQTNNQADQILGWLSIDVDTKSMTIKRYQMYLITIAITLLGLLLSLTIHYFLSKQISTPIARLRRSMKQILSNEFETEIKVSSTGEIGIIEKGCAHLQQYYVNSIKELNNHIEVATADLQQSLESLEEKNIELSLDKKKTEEKSRQKAELIANMSHDIRTPMNGVIGFTNVLLDSKLDPLQLDYVNTIKSSAQDLLTIINDILDYSKMDAGKLHLDCIPLDIRACIDEILALLAPIAHKKGIDIIPSTNIDVPKTMLGDPLRIKQMLSNLISNAIKFTEQGYVLIRTSIEQETDKNYHLIISVSDTGIGISTDDQATLFNAFNQGDTTITRRYGGSGLGLVICKKLAEQMHGRISINSELHNGSTFSIHIQLEKMTSYEVEKHQTPRFSHLKVICFDENPLHLEAICNGLGYLGIQCIKVSDFNQLEETFRDAHDCHMAFINVNQGCEQNIAKILLKQTLPCILISKWIIQDFKALGAQSFLFKPPNIQKLYETVELISNHTAVAENSAHELDTLRAQLRQANISLLIAEDNPVNQMLLQSMLCEHAVIEVVDDGLKAVDKCNHNHFNAILLDLQMPKLSGVEAAQKIHEKSLLNQQTPIMLISANDYDLSKDSLSKAGIKLVLQKPIDEMTLLHSILKIIHQAPPIAIDWPLCIQKLAGNQSLAREFLARFVQELPINRHEFLQLLDNQDIPGIERAAHKLHGACCFCGVPTLQKHVIHLEQLARQAHNIDELQKAITYLIESIDAILEDYKNKYVIERIFEEKICLQ